MSRDCCVAIPLSVMGLSAVCDCDIHLQFLGVIHANSDSFSESAHLLVLVWAFVTFQISHVVTQIAIECILCEQRRIWRVCTFAQAYLSLRRCTTSLVLPQMALCVLFTPAANTLVSLHICAGKITEQCNKYMYQDLLCWQQRLLRVCTFAQARLSLLHSIEISCAGWNGDFYNVYVNSEWCGESAPATTGLLCNHQCVVSMLWKMLSVRCNKIPQ